MSFVILLVVLGIESVSYVPPVIVPSAPTPTSTASPCPGDLDHGGTVTIDEVIRAIDALLDGCPR